ncbi:MAG: replication initiator protein [Microvirus sp.]|nr:MAG: replication initiator protein [Microvirus sp.]
MRCFKPIQGVRDRSGRVRFDSPSRSDGNLVEVRCGQCRGCRLQRSREWSQRIMHEASLYEANCFVTLTYSDDHLPPLGSLDHTHVQKFLKRLRAFFYPRTIRYYMCGEYGEALARPHYHFCLFNLNFLQDQQLLTTNSSGFTSYSSSSLTTLWPYGLHHIGTLTIQSAAYCARYIMDKITGDLSEAHYAVTDQDGVILGYRKPEYNCMSRRPGIGSGWYDKYSADLHNYDYAVHNGRRGPVGRYYDRLRKRRDPSGLDETKAERQVTASSHWQDNTPARLAVQDEVLAHALKRLPRTLK